MSWNSQYWAPVTSAKIILFSLYMRRIEAGMWLSIVTRVTEEGPWRRFGGLQQTESGEAAQLAKGRSRVSEEAFSERATTSVSLRRGMVKSPLAIPWEE